MLAQYRDIYHEFLSVKGNLARSLGEENPPLLVESLCKKLTHTPLPLNVMFVLLIKSHSSVCLGFPLSA